jgi:hypothetical protein
VIFGDETPVCIETVETSSDSSVNLVDGWLPSICSTDPKMVSFWTLTEDTRADISSTTVVVDSTATRLTDNEVLYLRVMSVLTDTGDARATMDGFLVIQT